jgi:hypothetical protein
VERVNRHSSSDSIKPVSSDLCCTLYVKKRNLIAFFVTSITTSFTYLSYATKKPPKNTALSFVIIAKFCVNKEQIIPIVRPIKDFVSLLLFSEIYIVIIIIATNDSMFS